MGAISQDSVKDCDQFAGRGDEGEAHDGEQLEASKNLAVLAVS